MAAKAKKAIITKIKLSNFKLNENNPRKITDEAFDKLCESIKRDPMFMELRPIIVDKNNIVIGGNQRYRACMKLGKKEVPSSWIRMAADLTPEQRKRFIVMDNAPDGVAGYWDFDMLKTEWGLPDLSEMGFDKLLTEFTGEVIDLQETLSTQSNNDDVVLHKCPKCGFSFVDTK